MRNRIAGLVHWDQIGIEHVPAEGEPSASDRLRDPLAVAAVVALLGVAVVLGLKAIFGRSD